MGAGVVYITASHEENRKETIQNRMQRLKTTSCATCKDMMMMAAMETTAKLEDEHKPLHKFNRFIIQFNLFVLSAEKWENNDCF